MKQIAYYESVSDKMSQCTPLAGSYHVTDLHFHRCFEILYVVAGSAVLEIGNKKYKAAAGNIVFVHQYQPHALYPSADYKMRGFIMGIELSNSLSDYLKEYTLPNILNDNQFNYTLLPYFERLVKTKSKNWMIQKGFVDVITGFILSHYKHIPNQKTANGRPIIEILNYIEEHYTEKLTLESLAKHFNYNPCYFSRFFKINTGKSLKNHINDTRLQYFLDTARNHPGDKNLCDMAMMSGFESMTTFYRTFSRHFTISTTELLKGFDEGQNASH